MPLDDPRTGRPDHLNFDGRALNSKGYKLLAKLTLDELTNQMLAVEWAVWKSALGTTGKAEGPMPSIRSAE